MSKRTQQIKSLGKNGRKIVKKSETLKSVSKGGRIFSVVFTKKDGSQRKMVCRKGVVKHLRGGKSTTKHIKSLVTVYDTQAKGYRSINLKTLTQVKGCNKTFMF